MFTNKNKDKSELEKTIADLHAEMATVDGNSAQYTEMVKNLAGLYKIRAEHDAPRRISPDTALLVAGNLAGILMIVGHERANVVTSKALGFVLKAVK